jgi:hypothetical protein
MSQLKQLIHEMHQRSLWQVLLVYVGGALVAYQVVQALTEGLGLPQWFPGLAVGLFVIGLPIVVATALVQEVAPHVPPTATDPERVEAETAAARRDAWEVEAPYPASNASRSRFCRSRTSVRIRTTPFSRTAYTKRSSASLARSPRCMSCRAHRSWSTGGRGGTCAK